MIKAELSERNLIKDMVLKIAKFLNTLENVVISLCLFEEVKKALRNILLSNQGAKMTLSKTKN